MKENVWGHIFDSLAELKTASLVTTSAQATVDGTAAYFDTGGGYTEGKLVLDVTACSSATTLDLFEIRLQGGTPTTFTTFVTLAKLQLGNVSSGSFYRLGAAAAGKDGSANVTTGRFIIPWTNLFNGTVYRYLRVYHAMFTPATGINYTAFLTQA